MTPPVCSHIVSDACEAVLTRGLVHQGGTFRD